MKKNIVIIIRLIRRFPVEKLEYALDLLILKTEKQLALPGTVVSQAENPERKIHYEDHELMTIKDAQDYMSRTKLYQLRKEGKLDTIEHSSRDKRLIRAQVEELGKWRK